MLALLTAARNTLTRTTSLAVGVKGHLVCIPAIVVMAERRERGGRGRDGSHQTMEMDYVAEKKKYLEMPLENKRKLYNCGSRYIVLDKIKPWLDDVRPEKKVPKTEGKLPLSSENGSTAKTQSGTVETGSAVKPKFVRRVKSQSGTVETGSAAKTESGTVETGSAAKTEPVTTVKSESGTVETCSAAQTESGSGETSSSLDVDFNVDIGSSLESGASLDIGSSEETVAYIETSSSTEMVLPSKVSIFQGDITHLEVDAIVNAANKTLLGGGGVDGSIHRAAGKFLKAECRRLTGCKTGRAKITGGYNLPSKYVIHTVGPHLKDDSPTPEEKANLKGCYRESLKIAKEYNIRSVAFPCISTGVYGYPPLEAAEVALGEVKNWLVENKDNLDLVDRIIFCVYLDDDMKIYKKLMPIYFPVDE